MNRLFHETTVPILVALVILIAGATAAVTVSAMTLEQVRERDELYCGISTEAPGFSKSDSAGNWHGLNVDVCQAVAAAVLGDADKVKFVPLTEQDHVTALLTGDVDLLSMNRAWNLSYDTLIGLDFCGITYYDGQGFLVPVALGIQSGLELDNVSICVEPPEKNPASLHAFFTTHTLKYKIVEPGKEDSSIASMEAGRCDVLTGDVSRLAALRQQFTDPDQFIILPELISRRPLGPVVRQGDDGWFNIVRWVLFGLKIAEEKGITAAAVGQLQDSEDPEVRRILGLEGELGKGLGIADDWLLQVIRQVGNYGELFERNLGRDSDLQMDRTINELWTRGGLHYGAALD